MVRTERRVFNVLLALALGSLAGGLTGACGGIPMNRAMEVVHDRYTELFYRVESGDRRGILDAAWSLREALDDPRVAGYSSDDGFQRYLQAARRASGEFFEDPASLDPERSRTLRRRVRRSCESCHEAHRH